MLPPTGLDMSPSSLFFLLVVPRLIYTHYATRSLKDGSLEAVRRS